jgi:hypothetical protein
VGTSALRARSSWRIRMVRAVPSFELAISQAIYHSKWLLGRFLGLMKGIEGQATETAA